MPEILTNKFNLPEVFVQACKIDRHFTNGDISVTGLIDSPQIFMLKKNHEYEVDVSEKIDMLLGTAMHHVFELAEVKHFSARQLLSAAQVLKDLGRQKGADSLVEIAKENFPAAFTNTDKIEFNVTLEIEGITVSGTLDKYLATQKKIQDYKNTSVYQWIYPEAKRKWDAQLNVYAAMMRENGYPVEEAEIVAVFKDFSAMQQKRTKDYPKAKAMTIPIKLLPHDDVMKYIKKAVLRHKAAWGGADTFCTPKERWATADTYAVKSVNDKGELGKKALRVLDSKELAQEWIDLNQLKFGNMAIEPRPGEQKRCDQFCPVRHVCPQLAAMNKIRHNVDE